MSRTKMVAVALVVTMVGVWAVRSFLLDDSESTAPTQTSAVSAEAESPRPNEPSAVPATVAVVAAGEVAGVPVGYPRSSRGAVTAAVNWVASLPTVVRLGPLRLADTMSQLLSEDQGVAGAEEVVADYFELFDELGPDFASRVWIESPLQVTTTQTSDSAADVSVWSMLVTGDPVDGPIEALWRTHHISLVWERDDWRIDDVTIAEGPTPVPTGTALPSEPSDFVGVDSWEPAVFADTTTEVE